MNFLRQISRPVAGLLALFLFCAAHAQPPADLVFFGDSLTDSGNKYFDRGIRLTPPYDQLDQFLVPSDPYARGGGNHTNGALWADYVARAVGRGGDSGPALASNGTAGNYAYGGARAGELLQSDNRNLTEQVSIYLADVNDAPAATTKHIVFIGGNDVAESARAFFFLLSQEEPFDVAFGTALAIIGAGQSAIAENVAAIRMYGGTQFVMATVPNVGLIPSFGGIPGGRDFANCMSILFNEGSAVYGQLPCPALPQNTDFPGIRNIASGLDATGADVELLEIYAIFQNIIDNAASFGITNVTDSCVTSNVAPPFACKKPDQYAFWDGIHPTKRLHQLIGEAAAAALSGP